MIRKLFVTAWNLVGSSQVQNACLCLIALVIASWAVTQSGQQQELQTTIANQAKLIEALVHEQQTSNTMIYRSWRIQGYDLMPEAKEASKTPLGGAKAEPWKPGASPSHTAPGAPATQSAPGAPTTQAAPGQPVPNPEPGH